jgi:hypothetical protein
MADRDLPYMTPDDIRVHLAQELAADGSAAFDVAVNRAQAIMSRSR